jgi:hypothetical protein
MAAVIKVRNGDKIAYYAGEDDDWAQWTDDKEKALVCTEEEANEHIDQLNRDYSGFFTKEWADDVVPFMKHDYVLYVGTNKLWRGFYIVHSVHEDGTLFLRAANCSQINACPPSDVKRLYRPPSAEIEAAN